MFLCETWGGFCSFQKYLWFLLGALCLWVVGALLFRGWTVGRSASLCLLPKFGSPCWDDINKATVSTLHFIKLVFLLLTQNFYC